jgi:uncharacterized membrane protein
MSDQLELVVGIYVNAREADERYNELRKAHLKKDIHLIDAVVLEKDKDGNVTVNEEDDLEGREGRNIGAIVGGLVGLAMGPGGLLGAAIGAGLGAAAGAVTGGAAAGMIDSGIKNKHFKGIIDALEPTSSALMVVIESDHLDKIKPMMRAPQSKLKRYRLALNISEEIE